MSKLAVHIEHYKRGAVGSLGGHNWYKRGEKDQHSNQDIDPQRSKDNMALVLPESGSLYREVKGMVEQSTGRVTSASVWVSEWCVYPPESLQDPKTADRGEVERYFRDVLDWMKDQGYVVPLAVVHMDETTVHMQADTVPLTADGKLSRKDVYTRAALNGIHTDLAKYLAGKGWDIQRGESSKDKQVRSVGITEYKKQAEAMKQEAEAKLEDLQGQIGGLQADQAQLQEQLTQGQQQLALDRERRQQEQAYYEELHRTNEKNLKIIQENDAIIREQEDTLRLIQSYEEYEGEAVTINKDMDLLEEAAKDLPRATRLFKANEANAWLERMNEILKDIRRMIGAGIRRLQIFESRYIVDEKLSEPAQKRCESLDRQIFGAASRTQPEAPQKPKTKSHTR